MSKEKLKTYHLNDAQLDMIAWAESHETVSPDFEAAISLTLRQAFDTQFLLKQKLNITEQRVQKLRDNLRTEAEKISFDANRKRAYRRRQASYSGLLGSFVRHEHLRNYITSTCSLDANNRLIVNKNALREINNQEVVNRILALEGLNISKTTATKLSLKIHTLDSQKVETPAPAKRIVPTVISLESLFPSIPAYQKENVSVKRYQPSKMDRFYYWANTHLPDTLLGTVEATVKAPSNFIYLCRRTFEDIKEILSYPDISQKTAPIPKPPTPYRRPSTETEVANSPQKSLWWYKHPSRHVKIEPESTQVPARPGLLA